jgi:hypothetical protein
MTTTASPPHTPAVVPAHPAAQVQPHDQPHGQPRGHADPCTMIILGALGDLSRRKLLPAIYQLLNEHLVNEEFQVLGVGRDASQTDDTFRAQMGKALAESDEVGKFDDAVWQKVCKRLHFVSADFTDASDYEAIGKRLIELEKGRAPGECNRIFSLDERTRAADAHARGPSVDARRRRETVRPQPRERADAQPSRARTLRRASDVSH